MNDMDNIEEVLKDNLKSKVDNSFTMDTMAFIKRKERTKRIALGVLLLIVSVISLPFIPFESLIIQNIPYLDLSIVINRNYVFIAFTFTIVLFFDTLFRSFLGTNQTNITTK